jgi:hypothetical protein
MKAAMVISKPEAEEPSGTGRDGKIDFGRETV